MRIVIDLQGAQTESRFRGIGRYSLSLAQAIVRNKGKHEIIITLSDRFPDTIEPIRAAFESLLPRQNIRVWSAPGPVRESGLGNTRRRKTAELIREAFLASLQPDIVHIMNLFEGYMDDAVTSIGCFDQSTPVSVNLYDLIPLKESDLYLKNNPVYEQYYLRKINYIKRASLLLSISESARQEGINRLGLFPESVVNISGAADERFQPVSLSQQDKDTILTKFSIARPFLLYSSGFDEHKNLPRLIRAYAKISNQLRSSHQLIFSGKIQEDNLLHLEQVAKDAGLRADEIVFTGYVKDEELVKLYNLSNLCILTSWHESFGLSALEAMACGRAMIGASTNGVPEVIGREDALFDPLNENAITEKLNQVLSDNEFREELEQYGLEQSGKFSWDRSATQAIAAIEQFHAGQKSAVLSSPSRRPTLAYISPLPPAHTGIADYSADLLPELARHYEIEVIVDQESVCDSWINANLTIRDLAWFRSHAPSYSRILYHIGNSPFHQHMFSLLKEMPGVVVLHDFFVADVVRYLDVNGIKPGFLTTSLYDSHGYKAVGTQNTDEIVLPYPCNLSILQNAQGIIVHSETSRLMAKQWYGNKSADEWVVIPSLSSPAIEGNRQEARMRLNLDGQLFITCCFGMLGPTKLNDRLIEAYIESKLSKEKDCILVFVGENPGGKYGETLLETIYSNGMKDRIRITERVNTDTYRSYLEAANIGIQLRTFSRGETSRAVLDCLSHGLATIVNAHGSMVDLPNDGVWKLPNEFSNEQLVNALETLWRDQKRRRKLGDQAKETIRLRHTPRICADQYANAMEHFYNKSTNDIYALTKAIGKTEAESDTIKHLPTLAKDIAQSISPSIASRQLFLDVSALVQRDLKTGIQRVIRSILNETLNSPPQDYRVEPIYADKERGYFYARRFTLGSLGYPNDHLTDEPVEYQAGDVFFCLDLHYDIVVAQQEFYKKLRRYGVEVQFLVHDLLPIQLPQYFPEGAAEWHIRWLKVVAESDGVVCVTRTVADEFNTWIKKNYPKMQHPFKISWSHNGADIDASIPTKGLPGNANSIFKILKARPTFLMVGTIEPRKGHAQTLAAFEQLWEEGININLVIVGKEGWKDLPDEMRRTIPELANRLRHHPELGKRLFWLEDISDEYLKMIYASATCLIAASEGEGFGLPLIEAAQHKLPIIARDIPVFREVAGKHAFYFQGLDPESLSQVIKRWLNLFEINQSPSSDRMPWLTWKQSAEQIISIICSETPQIQ